VVDVGAYMYCRVTNSSSPLDFKMFAALKKEATSKTDVSPILSYCDEAVPW
jgi:hypothetical protein